MGHFQRASAHFQFASASQFLQHRLEPLQVDLFPLVLISPFPVALAWLFHPLIPFSFMLLLPLIFLLGAFPQLLIISFLLPNEPPLIFLIFEVRHNHRSTLHKTDFLSHSYFYKYLCNLSILSLVED